ncbi:xylose isomerase [Mycobacterium sp. CBMA 234]|uniref:sugar phosphate isomerase/epimerase family protein n=1 Tax=Mycolicibacterium sp. CBMA 234 TaxID=1918495 RepID=UPI0012DE9D69|nr:TIM barrel protein [Mycolicibacterium sp. CBMA 234]MUL63040.1 xylose isomerase [Mycolicibacterium sp. CBMA 234]
MNRLGIEALSVFGLPPVEFVDVAADLGCRYITVFLRNFAVLPLGYPQFSLKDDSRLKADLLAALAHRGVSISLGDGFLVLPDADMRLFATDLDLMAELGVPQINVVSLDPDRVRSFDQVAILAELAAQRQLATVIEPVPGLTIGDLPTALAAIAHIGRPDVRLVIDTMHLVRSGSGANDLAAVAPELIGYAQLCDTTLAPQGDNYAEEAMFERMVPREGELPLADIVAVLPDDVVIGLEVPRRALALAGVGPADRLRPCVEAAQALLQRQA